MELLTSKQPLTIGHHLGLGCCQRRQWTLQISSVFPKRANGGPRSERNRFRTKGAIRDDR